MLQGVRCVVLERLQPRRYNGTMVEEAYAV